MNSKVKLIAGFAAAAVVFGVIYVLRTNQAEPADAPEPSVSALAPAAPPEPPEVVATPQEKVPENKIEKALEPAAMRTNQQSTADIVPQSPPNPNAPIARPAFQAITGAPPTVMSRDQTIEISPSERGKPRGASAE